MFNLVRREAKLKMALVNLNNDNKWGRLDKRGQEALAWTKEQLGDLEHERMDKFIMWAVVLESFGVELSPCTKGAP